MTKNNNRTLEVLEYFKTFLDNNGYPPSVRDIGAALGMKSTATVKYYLDKLTAGGMLIATPNIKRGLRISNSDTYSNKKKERKNKIPLVGNVPAGAPKLAFENIMDYYSIPELFKNSDELFMLNVEGNSMIEAGIFNGDMIIVRKQTIANNGDIVVAFINNEESATVKRFYKEKGYYRLKPENSTMQDIVVNDLSILGIVVGLIRKMH